ncbi:MAG TPA: DNA starvation/stationary phase protection protein Dps, partial [Steroidobacteraceae bacterium]|nr:DNA starvation/stationary phase protection protein Dps [Steroidobacteraceae bacterium]
MAAVTCLRQHKAMHKTRNDLSLDIRTRVSQLLNSRLASAIDLYLQTKHAHWNVKGPSFIALHELFDKLGEELEEHIDDIAERAVALGAVAEGTSNVVVERTQLARYPVQINEGLAHVDALANAYAVFGKSVREAIDDAGKAGDADSSDLFTGISRGIDK